MIGGEIRQGDDAEAGVRVRPAREFAAQSGGDAELVQAQHDGVPSVHLIRIDERVDGHAAQ